MDRLRDLTPWLTSDDGAPQPVLILRHSSVLGHGRVVEEGRYDDLLAARGRFVGIFAD
ncbi:hypothetical protein SAMN05421756_103360 [Microlunatus flavus]|uniref:Uncharacterized protein n=1 Tax=Microlunatus flavus TaxID=1036181 RepID=A0A1H9FSY7_9ACTN|nr:hypothetical protein SAMN05421756_103360 [Microlunatus flavus]